MNTNSFPTHGKLVLFGGPGEWSVSWEPPAPDGRLLSCPFCGSQNVWLLNTHNPTFWTRCDDCSAEGPHAHPVKWDGGRIKTKKQLLAFVDEAMDKAVQGWNTSVERKAYPK